MSELRNFEWQKWLSKNLMFGCTPEQLAKIASDTTKESYEKSLEEIISIRDSGVFYSASAAYNLVQRREWLLSSLNDLRKLEPNYLKVEKIKTPKLSDFIKNYYALNKPVILLDAINHWPASKWTPESLKNEIGEDFEIEVMKDRNRDNRYEEDMDSHRSTMKFGEYVDKIVLQGDGNDIYVTGNSSLLRRPEFNRILVRDTKNVGKNYLKIAEIPTSTHMWLGPKNTITALHWDLPNAFLAQIYGEKRIRMIPSMQVGYMYNNMAYTSDADFRNIDYNKFPNMRHIDVLDVHLKQGELLFIPVGWWHEVTSLTPSISLTINAINAYNDQHKSFAASTCHFRD